MATKIKLLQKSISGNRQSLYLDFWPPIINEATNEATRREFLGLYLYDEIEIVEERYLDANNKEQKRFVTVLDKKGNPKKLKLTPVVKKHNEDILKLAEQIRQKRQKQYNGNESLNELEKRMLANDKKETEIGERNFIEYFRTLADKKKGSNSDNWASAYNYLEAFTSGSLRFADLNTAFCEDFKHYLLTTKSKKSIKVTLSQNSAVSYFNKFKATLKQAYKDKLLKEDLNGQVDCIEVEETRRNFLTIEELNNLVKTECKNPELKNAALFSALTGLRFSDIKKLTWKEIEFIKGQGYFINFKQQKTKGIEVMPISEQAFDLLGDRQKPNDKIFEELVYSAYTNKHLANWLGLAGITKDITFHCFRHTYATLQLFNGTDIYTVSKMLGHRDLKTTQIYAHMVDEAKRTATNKIKLKM